MSRLAENVVSAALQATQMRESIGFIR